MRCKVSRDGVRAPVSIAPISVGLTLAYFASSRWLMSARRRTCRTMPPSGYPLMETPSVVRSMAAPLQHERGGATGCGGASTYPQVLAATLATGGRDVVAGSFALLTVRVHMPTHCGQSKRSTHPLTV